MAKKWISVICVWIISFTILLTPLTARGQNESANESTQENSGQQTESADLIQAPSGVLMEAQTGTVIYQKDLDTRRSPASITKIMTLILIFDALEKGNLKLDDIVTTSAYAKSMGGSQVFLEEGETQTVETLIKCIVIASGNDASVAMAEHICGSEQEFVRHMNERATELGMKNTHFEDCCGLTDSSNHYTTARDIAIMSRELITKYPKILEYSSIWMENITHVTKQGTKEFGLTNTNKLLRSYDGCVGLKTGSTSLAKYCLSAVAKRNKIILIAVVMAAPDYKVRFKDAASMLNYGFSRCSLYIDEKMQPLPEVPVKKGKEKSVPLVYEKQFQYLNTDGETIGKVEKKLRIHREVKAPLKKGSQAGEMIYSADGKELGRVRILYARTIGQATYLDCVKELLKKL
ncbi:D-alanyl-D-alanine carboxypeptidase [Ruminococcus sp. AF37-6AT]|jgi:D-alanyl-D-alanine carboxypeptidase (penicillin-binding protein 5/6)|uniref:D-alanyl-D-alanine carboxypeptidase family protein n=1 Tax=Blautia sp. HCN-1074 TaxID=3134667 RepID=UPI000E43EAC5|nr:D-alanyl-D-alanine carboxypeptidase [Ruminococcus sp. TM10-9AT]RGW22758.1 D-alanyl-D-alanine carboxypeptidase [Ruminococcus sp. AF13-37]RGW24514.1 D-alanyl-D-alanine carboxypeptidase [Ruminococcus sp. AF13-28]RHD93608.1 D-alanyl-D-alanine carboxypeptidase [Ruminococcus sp. AM30-15AC]RHK00036.1 D-alanyl-D-alanine carboxypeptidase [Ruminococcus sp. AM07-21]RHL51200.1 D-alanyl-D-alanine carboxypeptidase [Ruminococcus sp. AF37-6AT]RHP58501.1 D-alanyl-D-alanine carboxypeptidase [Ruminococcus sp